MSLQVIDIRLMEARDFEPLLKAESSAWITTLRWDYGPSARLISACLEDKRLSGYALLSDRRILGYCFFLYEGEKGLIGDLFVQPNGGSRDHALLLLENVIATLKATPGLRRVEAQLPHFAVDELSDYFREQQFRIFHRRFMALRLDGRPTRGLQIREAGSSNNESSGLLSGEFFIDKWQRDYDQAAARLLYFAYRGHVDAMINDQYGSLAGSARLIENIMHLRGCGENLPEASRTVIHRASRKLAGILALTAVRPGTAHIPQVAIANEFQRRGLGATLMESSFRELDRLGYREVSLTVTDENQDAVRFYERIGFETFRTFGAFVWNRPGSADL
ncbi:MAG TPA: GNAT family N-acetyltransferase [Terriglobia bacterium]|nr:GNAT family N-acetyltransferase [Terriglobia bacterium]